MRCPHCGKSLNPRAASCKYCYTRLVRPSDKLARKMTASRQLSMVAGGLLVFLAVVLALNAVFLLAGGALLVGAALLLISGLTR